MLIIVYFLEVGVVLIVAPWTTFWDRNYFVESLPLLEGVLTTPGVRGGVTGVGILSLAAAVLDVGAAVRRRLAVGASAQPQSMLGDTLRAPGSPDLRGPA